MIIYVEKNVKNLLITDQILEKYPNSDILYINHYKNIFDKKFVKKSSEKILILASSPKNIFQPSIERDYHYQSKSYFVRTGLNCIFGCTYCYLQSIFKNDFVVLFLDYESQKQKWSEQIKSIRADYEWKLVFYVSNYNDLQGYNFLSNWNENMLDFLDSFENIHIESRTKTILVDDLLSRNPPKNFELSFSLSPETIVKKFEIWTPSLEKRLITINKLLQKNYKIWLRFMPLLPYQDYKNIYEDFLKFLVQKIDVEEIYSMFAGTLLYPKNWNFMDFDENLVDEKNFWKWDSNAQFLTLNKSIRQDFEEIFQKYLPNCKISD